MTSAWNRPNNPMSQKGKTSGLLPTKPVAPMSLPRTPGLGRSRFGLKMDRSAATPKKGHR